MRNILLAAAAVALLALPAWACEGHGQAPRVEEPSYEQAPDEGASLASTSKTGLKLAGFGAGGMLLGGRAALALARRR
jgi:hypothetical protein